MKREAERIVRVSFDRRIPLVDHVCPVCGARFKGHKLAVYDKSECKNRAAWERTGEERNRKRRKGERAG